MTIASAASAIWVTIRGLSSSDNVAELELEFSHRSEKVYEAEVYVDGRCIVHIQMHIFVNNVKVVTYQIHAYTYSETCLCELVRNGDTGGITVRCVDAWPIGYMEILNPRKVGRALELVQIFRYLHEPIEYMEFWTREK